MSYQKSTTKQHTTTLRSERVKMLERDLRAFLKPSRHAVFSFIFDRTVRFNKEWERIPIRHMLQGVHSKSGEMIHGGLSIGESTVYRCLNDLRELGIIVREEVPCGLGNTTFKYKIEWDCVDEFITEKQISARNAKCSQNVGAQNDSTPLSDRKAPPVKMEVHNNRKITTEINNRSKEERASCAHPQGRKETGEVSPEVPKDTISDIRPINAAIHTAKSGAKKGTEIQQLKSTKNEQGRLTSGQVYSRWKHEVSSNWPDARLMQWTPKEFGCVKNLVTYVGEDAMEFLTWCVSNWHMVRIAKFSKGDKVKFPDYPDFQFLFAFRKQFFAVWTERDFHRRMAGNPMAGMIVSLRKQGYTEEQATEIAAEREVEKTKLSEIERREADLLKRERQLAYGQRYVNRGATPEEQERAATNAARAKSRSRQVPTEFRKINTEITEW